MVNALSEVDGSILDCKKSLEEFDNELLNLHTEIFDRIQKQFSDLDSEISNIIDLFDDFEVSDEKGVWSKEAIAQMGLMAQQYELAEYQVQQYNSEIDELNKQYLAGRYSATEYADRLSELSSAQWDAVKSAESAKDAIWELNEVRVENEIAGIEKEIDAYDELTQAQIEALRAAKDLHDYENSIADKTKTVSNLERQIAAMSNDTSASTVAKRKQLEEQLAEAKKDLEEAEYEHSIEVQEDALNKQFEEYETTRNKEIEALRESLNDREAILSASFETVKANASIVGQEIANIALEHGITVSNTLISSWQSGENAIASYGDVLSQGTSAFIGNIMGVEGEVWNLQSQANNTADSLAWMFSTKADNLVNELTASYLAEENLTLMTQTLQDTLINTLERGYDISSIVSSLNSITDAANRAKAAIDELNNERTPDTSQSSSKGYTGGGGSKTVSYERLTHYAGGTRNSKGNLVITDEEGYEMKLPKLPNGQYTLLNEGSQVFTKEQTDNLYEMSKSNLDDYTKIEYSDFIEELRKTKGNGKNIAEPLDLAVFTPTSTTANMMQEMFKNANISESVVDKSMNPTVNIHYDSMVTVNGDVNDIKHLTDQITKIADKSSVKAADNAIRKLAEGLRR